MLLSARATLLPTTTTNRHTRLYLSSGDHKLTMSASPASSSNEDLAIPGAWTEDEARTRTSDTGALGWLQRRFLGSWSLASPESDAEAPASVLKDGDTGLTSATVDLTLEDPDFPQRLGGVTATFNAVNSQFRTCVKYDDPFIF